MDLRKMLAELRDELADLDAAIASLEQIPQQRPGRAHPVPAQLSLPAPGEANSRDRGPA